MKIRALLSSVSLVAVLTTVAYAAAGLDFLIHLQDTAATVTARWTYTANPEYETWYEYIVEDEAAADTIMADSTSLQETTFTINRTETDKAYRFGVRVVIKDALGSIARSGWIDDRFIVPARPAAGLLAKRDMVTSPVIVPNDPAFEQDRGTVWLEFETRADITTVQGLWSRDHNGYQNGGHLTIFIRDGSVVARIQSDSTSYEVQWPIVANSVNQAAVEFGDDTGFRLHVNAALAMTDPYTGGTVGNSNDIVVGADKMSYRDTIPDEPWANPFSGTVRVSEFYAGRYDFSGRWGLPPLPPPAPVDSLNIEVAQIDRGITHSGMGYMSVRFTPIPEAEYIVRFVNGDTLDHYGKWKPALLAVAGADWYVSCSGACKADSSWRGWEMYNAETGERCSATYDGWTTAGTHPCVTREEIIAGNRRNNDCVGGRIWAKHASEIECNFNILSSLRANFYFEGGTNPLLRFEVFDIDRRRIAYWERRAA